MSTRSRARPWFLTGWQLALDALRRARQADREAELDLFLFGSAQVEISDNLDVIRRVPPTEWKPR